MNLKKIMDYCLVICLILNFNTFFAGFLDRNFSLAIYFITIFILIIYVFGRKDALIRLKKVGCNLVFYYCYILIFLIVNNIENYFVFSIYYLIIFPLLICYFDEKLDLKCIIKYFINIVLIISVISLFFQLFGSTLEIIKPSGVLHSMWSDKDVTNYNYVFFETQKYSIGNHVVNRNSAIFTEPAMFAIILSLALMLKNIIEYRSKIIDCILIITLLTTTSTSGIIIMIIYYTLIALFKRKKYILKIITGPIILIFAILIFDNLLVNKMGEMSGKVRVDDIKACVSVWKNNLMFGCGYNNFDTIKNQMSAFRNYNQGLSSSFFVILAQGGIYLISLYIFSLLKYFLTILKKKKTKEMIFILAYFVMFVTLVFNKTIISFIPLAIGINKKLKLKKEIYLENDK